MANALTTGAWFSAPTKRPSFFARLLRAHLKARQRRAERVVEHYLASRGLKRPDGAERRTQRLLLKAGR